MQISMKQMKQMKFKVTIDMQASRKNIVTDVNENANENANGNANGNSNHICSDCKVDLVRQQMEFVCPRCGIVEEFIEGSE